jgi:hypothetical protein
VATGAVVAFVVWMASFATSHHSIFAQYPQTSSGTAALATRVTSHRAASAPPARPRGQV